MEAYAQPIRALGERIRDFVARPRARLFHVWTDAALRDGAIELVMGFEHHADNRSPFVRFDDASAKDGSCWDARLATLRRAHDARRAAMEKQGYALPALGPAPSAGTPLARFAAGLRQALDARCDPLRGLILVLAPGMIEDGPSFDRDLSGLTSASELAGARWIVVEQGACSITAAHAHATGADHLRVEVDEDLACRELEMKLDAAAAAPAGASGPAMAGAAWPRDASPPGSRNTARAAQTAARVAASLGLPAGMFGPALLEMRGSILRGALAFRRGDPASAAIHQSRAAQSCHAAGLHREACLMDLVLATYILHAGDRETAEGRYRGVAERARDRGWHDLSAQALMALGSVRLISRDRPGASVAYGWAGAVAKEGRCDDLAIEGYRMAGQLAADDGNEELAARLFSQAIAIATGMPEPAAGRTSAPLAARQLADCFTRLGSREQATSLRAQADRMERAAR